MTGCIESETIRPARSPEPRCAQPAASQAWTLTKSRRLVQLGINRRHADDHHRHPHAQHNPRAHQSQRRGQPANLRQRRQPNRRWRRVLVRVRRQRSTTNGEGSHDTAVIANYRYDAVIRHAAWKRTVGWHDHPLLLRQPANRRGARRRRRGAGLLHLRHVHRRTAHDGPRRPATTTTPTGSTAPISSPTPPVRSPSVIPTRPTKPPRPLRLDLHRPPNHFARRQPLPLHRPRTRQRNPPLLLPRSAHTTQSKAASNS